MRLIRACRTKKVSILTQRPANRPSKSGMGHGYYLCSDEARLYVPCSIIDLHTRYVVNRSVSNTMTAEWCTDVVNEAIGWYGKPQIFNTDQGGSEEKSH
ncbi:MAG: DDE-type integrase/transposase/recombinase [Bacteroidota bacterium]|nr:MAG: DDE-type integrase/transposase/recombinase [Bacteroidota bacterium]